MKCPNCRFICSDLRDVCPKCLLDLRPQKRVLGLPITKPFADYEELISKAKPSKQGAQSAKQSKTSSPGLIKSLSKFFSNKKSTPTEAPPSSKLENREKEETTTKEAEKDIPNQVPKEQDVEAKDLTPLEAGDNVAEGTPSNADFDSVAESTPAPTQPETMIFNSGLVTPPLTIPEPPKLDNNDVKAIDLDFEEKEDSSQKVETVEDLEPLSLDSEEESLADEPKYTPEVLDLSDHQGDLEDILDKMIGDETLSIETVPVPKAEKSNLESDSFEEHDEDSEFDFEIEIESEESDDSEVTDLQVDENEIFFDSDESASIAEAPEPDEGWGNDLSDSEMETVEEVPQILPSLPPQLEQPQNRLVLDLEGFNIGERKVLKDDPALIPPANTTSPPSSPTRLEEEAEEFKLDDDDISGEIEDKIYYIEEDLDTQSDLEHFEQEEEEAPKQGSKIEHLEQIPDPEESETNCKTETRSKRVVVDPALTQHLFDEAQRAIENDPDVLEIGLDQISNKGEDPVVELLFNLAEETIDDPESYKRYTDSLLKSEERHLQAESLEKQLSRITKQIETPTLGLRGHKRQHGPGTDLATEGLHVNEEESERPRPFEVYLPTVSERVLAFMVDVFVAILISVPASIMVAAFVLGTIPKTNMLTSLLEVKVLIAHLDVIAITFLTSFFVLQLATSSLYATSIGGSIFHHRIINDNGSPLKLLNAFVRIGLFPVSILLGGLLPALHKKRPMHDYLAKTILRKVMPGEHEE